MSSCLSTKDTNPFTNWSKSSAVQDGDSKESTASRCWWANFIKVGVIMDTERLLRGMGTLTGNCRGLTVPEAGTVGGEQGLHSSHTWGGLSWSGKEPSSRLSYPSSLSFKDPVLPVLSSSFFRLSRSNLKKYFWAWVLTCVAFRVLTCIEMALTSL